MILCLAPRGAADDDRCRDGFQLGRRCLRIVDAEKTWKVLVDKPLNKAGRSRLGYNRPTVRAGKILDRIEKDGPSSTPRAGIEGRSAR